jgi:hypothetical protein
VNCAFFNDGDAVGQRHALRQFCLHLLDLATGQPGKPGRELRFAGDVFLRVHIALRRCTDGMTDV